MFPSHSPTLTRNEATHISDGETEALKLLPSADRRHVEATKELKRRLQGWHCPAQRESPMGRAPGLPESPCLTHRLDPSLTWKEMCCGQGLRAETLHACLVLLSQTRGERLHWSHFTDEKRGGQEPEVSGLPLLPGLGAKQGSWPSSSVFSYPESKAWCCVRSAEEP